MIEGKHVWLLSHNFPPEVNALATRTFEHAREWAKAGYSFDVITDVPHFPEGRVYIPYKNRFQHETYDGISVYRMPVYPAENRRKIRRTLSYISFLVSTVLNSWRVKKRPTVIVASSPQIFTAFAGFILSLLYRVPFVMEIRDLWPQSIKAVGAMNRSLLLRLIEIGVGLLYRHARLIVVLTESFRKELVSSGVDPLKIVMVPNGISSEFFSSAVPDAEVEILRESLGLCGKFVVCYIGTIGMAHGLETIINAAKLTDDPAIQFLIVGTGASRGDIEQRLNESGLTNVVLLPKVPRSQARVLLQLSHVALVLLKDVPLFRTVIPSKLIEAMGCAIPVVLGVRGEAQELLEGCGGGLCIEPENASELASAVMALKGDPAMRERLGENAHASVFRSYNRSELAQRLWSHILSV